MKKILLGLLILGSFSAYSKQKCYKLETPLVTFLGKSLSATVDELCILTSASVYGRDYNGLRFADTNWLIAVDLDGVFRGGLDPDDKEISFVSYPKGTYVYTYDSVEGPREHSRGVGVKKVLVEGAVRINFSILENEMIRLNTEVR